MQTLILGAGLCFVICGAIYTWMTATSRRTGKPWRGSAFLAGGTLLYAGVLLSGRFNPPTTLGAALVAVVAVLMWVGVVISLRERRKAEAGRQA
jgi:peptidoglycan/LPS O-acetylase OafA/YrhL